MRRLAITTALLALAISGSAEATFPGPAGRITFTREGPEPEHTWAIFSAQPDGRGLRKLSDQEPADAMSSDSSRDGELIAFDSDATGSPQVWLMDADGRRERQLTDSPGYAVDAAWAPDGRTLAFESDFGDFPAKQGIWMASVRHKGLVREEDARRLTAVPADADFDGEPQFSPDGRWLAFTRFRAEGAESAIFRVRVWGGQPERLTEWADNASAPDYSPDGRWIVFDTNDVGSKDAFGDIRLMRADGSRQRTRVAGNPAELQQNPVFSPRGGEIAFIRYQSAPVGYSSASVWRLDLRSGLVKRVTDSPSFDNRVDWSVRR
jgi:Tol biopolymer transport system component